MSPSTPATASQAKESVSCPMDFILRMLMGPWTTYILYNLRTHGPQRFGELKRRVSGISAKMLTERLRTLEGAALVWLPVATWFFVTGAIWQGFALAAWGVLVIGLVDNLLRPMLVGKTTLMPDYVVMITTLGGMVVFGINGFVLGPVIAAMFFAVWHLYLTTRQVEAPPLSPSDP